MKKISCLLILFMVLALNPIKSHAENQLNTDQVAVALVIDHSGSMNNTDPDNSRFTAAQMVLELLAESDFLSITMFGDEAVDLLPMTELEGAGLDRAKASLQVIPEDLGYTDYNRAFDQAGANLDLVTEDQVSKFIIFLTDGEPKVRDKTTDMVIYQAQLDQKMQDFASAGIPVYTVGFGESDQQILKEMSEQTRGVSFQGDNSTLADNFFEVLRELKNRYTITDTAVQSGISNFEFPVDEYTSRITVLVTDESMNGQVDMKDESGQSVAPVFEQGKLRVFHLNGRTEPGTQLYTLTGNWQGSIRAVRDTKTKLWITEPLNNAQVPYESEINVKVLQTGTVGTTATLSAVLKKEGKQLLQPLTITPEEGGYEIGLGQLPQTGIYELEVSLTNRNSLVARTSSSFQLKNIPILKQDLGQEQDLWIQGQERQITASLERGGFRVTNNLDDVEITLDLKQGEETITKPLLDDGGAASGDLIAGDGIYSARVVVREPGDLTYSMKAIGEYLNEPFFLTGQEAAAEVRSPATIAILLPEAAPFGENREVKVDVRLENQGTYAEQISASYLDQILFQGVTVEPGQSVKRQVTIPVANGETEGAISFESSYEATRFVQDRDRIRFTEPDVTPSLFTTRNLLIAGGVILGLLIVTVLLRKGTQKARTPKLQGELIYGKTKEDMTEKILLSGTSPRRFTIGKTRLSDQHLESDHELSFEFSLHPVFSQKGSAVAELRCSPPGLVSQNGQISTTTVLSHGDEFEMGGLFFRYELEEANEEGKNLLTGRL